MNSASLIEKLKLKVNETNDYIDNTNSRQINLLSTSKELNLKLRNFIESDLIEKKMTNECLDKMNKMKDRIETCKINIQQIKEKLKDYIFNNKK